MAIVYQHRTADTNELFYVGIGIDINRAQRIAQRSRIWTNVYKKHGRTVEILFSGISHDEAKQIEKYLIRFHGRRNDGGILVNLTDGGDGVVGRKISDEEKKRISQRLTGRKQSAETIERRFKNIRGTKQSPEVIANRVKKNTGKKRSEEFRQKCRERAGTFSKESIEKMRTSHLGVKTVPCSEEKKKAISAAQKGVPKPSSKNSKTLFKKGEEHIFYGKKLKK